MPAGRGERGAVLVHVAVAMMGLLAFSALTIDLGVAVGGRARRRRTPPTRPRSPAASSLAYVDPTDTDAAAGARRRRSSQPHAIWGEPVAPASMHDRRSAPARPARRRSPATACASRSRADGRRHAAAGVLLAACSASTRTSVRASASAQGHARQRDVLPAAAGDPRPLDRQLDATPVDTPGRRRRHVRRATSPPATSTPRVDADVHRRRCAPARARHHARPASADRRSGCERTDVLDRAARAPAEFSRSTCRGPAATATRERPLRAEHRVAAARCRCRSATSRSSTRTAARHDAIRVDALIGAGSRRALGRARRSSRQRVRGQPAADDDRGLRPGRTSRSQDRHRRRAHPACGSATSSASSSSDARSSGATSSAAGWRYLGPHVDRRRRLADDARRSCGPSRWSAERR